MTEEQGAQMLALMSDAAVVAAATEAASQMVVLLGHIAVIGIGSLWGAVSWHFFILSGRSRDWF